MYNRRIGSIRKLNKEIKKGNIDVMNLRLANFPLRHEIRLTEKFRLIKDRYEKGEFVVSMSSGDIYELSEPLINDGRKDIVVHYKQIWDYWGRMGYTKRYDDDFGGTISFVDPFLECCDLFKKYYRWFRLATDAEKRQL